MNMVIALLNMNTEAPVVGIQPREIKTAAGQLGKSLNFAEIFGQIVNVQPVSAGSGMEKQEQKEGDLMPPTPAMVQGTSSLVTPWVFLTPQSVLAEEQQINRTIGCSSAIATGLGGSGLEQKVPFNIRTASSLFLPLISTDAPTSSQATAAIEAVGVLPSAYVLQAEKVMNQYAAQPTVAQLTVASTIALNNVAAMLGCGISQYPQLQTASGKTTSQVWPDNGKGSGRPGAPMPVLGENVMSGLDIMPDDFTKPMQVVQPLFIASSEAGETAWREFTGEPAGQKQERLLPTTKPEHVDNSTSFFTGVIEQLNPSSFAHVTTPVNPASSTQTIHDPYKVVEQVVAQARLRLRADNSEMVIHLKPEHLGELTLKVAVENGGTVTASFHSTNPEVRSIIEASLPELKQELINQGFKVEYVGVYAGLNHSFMSDQRDQRQHIFAKAGLRKNMHQLAAVAAMETHEASYIAPAASGIDYRV
ncbi:flagellar hook-length control protein [Thermosinus carboxydivorans Nor1]|uniref:Flagellar hook-length control protein n=1 Tax=Thermosinus carboxydivorans Nor1 TaxID=401526 RepID=A1HN35_9FIRM|nr:flagellar hook-length control protein FliK [Thermosinus carboxydivorans]EAX48662.1 flagellar hook-length control protein [Thermosinus carboxydivorans Nor1]